MTFRDRRGGLYLRKLAHPMGFQNGIGKAKQPKPDCLEGPDSCPTNHIVTKQKKAVPLLHEAKKRRCLKGRTKLGIMNILSLD